MDVTEFHLLRDPHHAPVAIVSLLWTDSKPGGYLDPNQIVRLASKAISSVSYVKSHMELPSTVSSLKEWIGRWDTSAKMEIQRTLSSVAHVLNNVVFAYPGPACASKTVGYVYPHGYQCFGTLGSNSSVRNCRFDTHGNFVIYLCPAFTSRDDEAKVEIMLARSSLHWRSYLTDQCANRSHIQIDGTCAGGSYAITREQCSALAASDPSRSIKNAASFAYFVQAVADPAYSEKQRCKGSTRAITPFVDSDGNCACPAYSQCRSGSNLCPCSQGCTSSILFMANCTNCKCSRSSHYTCPQSALHRESDADGDCTCPERAVCHTYNRSGCRATKGDSSTRYFMATCTGCECKSFSSMTSMLPADDRKHDSDVETSGVEAWPLFRPSLVYIFGAIGASLLIAVMIVYCYRARFHRKARRIASDMEFQESLQAQQAQLVRV